ncbi:MAG: nicotinamide-nucleotide adenylyltransferase [Candidatus Saccharimonadales bacterium]
MSSKTIGLYIGKFQPFHNGHLYAIAAIAPTVDLLIIVIGSSQYSGLKNQPFSARQRRQMIEQTLKAEGINNFSIVEVPDIHDSEHWVEHVKKYVKQFNVVFTNSEVVQQLFSDKGFTVKSIKVLPGVSGTLVRQKIAAQENDWISLVPSATASIINASLISS